MATREALRLIDAEPVLDPELLALGRWIAGYYCAPLGEVLRGMLPLAADIRRGKVWSLTDAGRDAARQLLLDTAPDDPVAHILAHARKAAALGRLPREGAAAGRQSHPLAGAQGLHRGRAGRRRSRSAARAGRAAARRAGCPPPSPESKLNKPERELRAFLELHPGSHNLKELEDHGARRQRRRAFPGAQGTGFAAARNRGVRTPARFAPATS